MRLTCMYSGGVNFIEWPHEDKHFAVGFFDGYVKFGTKDPNGNVFTNRAHDGCLTGMSFDPTGTLLATCGGDRTCRIWSERNNYWMCSQEIMLDSEGVSLQWSTFAKDGTLLLVIGLSSGIASVWSLSSSTLETGSTDDINVEGEILTPKLLQTLRCHTFNPVTCLGIHRNGSIVATGGGRGNGVVNLWSVEHGTLIYTVTGQGGVTGLRWIGDNALAICFSRSRVI